MPLNYECDRCEKRGSKALHPYKGYFVCDPCADVLGVEH